MTTRIFYFSGTGNSLYVATQLQTQLPDSAIASIAQAVERKETIEGDCIGIVCPIYMHNLPHIVVDFLKQIERAGYLFVVFAGAGDLGRGDVRTDRACEKNGLHLNALFNIPMPSNYTPWGCPSQEQQQQRFRDAEDHIARILGIVSKRAEHRDGRGSSIFGAYVFPAILYRLGYARIRQLDNAFAVTDACNGCGICEKMCPVDNIKMKTDRPRWTNRCEQCYACLQWCPKQAIDVGKKTVGVPRYHHPEIKRKQLQRVQTS